jgi:predicted GIY-YIG superfamily endonuclease
MWYVYIIRSVSWAGQEYTGATSDLKQRLRDHNAGRSKHTSRYAPWQLAWYCGFHDKSQALEFEKYLKSHSGRAFASKRLTPRTAVPETGDAGNTEGRANHA